MLLSIFPHEKWFDFMRVPSGLLSCSRNNLLWFGYLFVSCKIAANIVLENTIERIYVKDKYGDIPLGLFLIRGENVVLLGDIVSEKILLCFLLEELKIFFQFHCLFENSFLPLSFKLLCLEVYIKERTNIFYLTLYCFRADRTLSARF